MVFISQCSLKIAIAILIRQGFFFDFNDEVVKRKINIKDPKITSFRFEEKAFYYTNAKNIETTINL